MAGFFSEAERAYLRGQRLVRLATVSAGGQPDVAPLGLHFRPDQDDFIVTGRNIPVTLKYKNVKANPRVSLVVDDLASVSPWHPRMIKVHGRADLIELEGREVIRVIPERKWTWGLEDSPPAG
jgi:pyridoxamine 5'-phosphate oxidase family protein